MVRDREYPPSTGSGKKSDPLVSGMDVIRVAGDSKRVSLALLKNPKLGPREAAYIAYLLSLKEEAFIAKSLHLFAENCPSKQTLALTYEIAQGTCRMALALDHIAAALSEKKALQLKLKEKALLRIALYQLFYLGNSPKHAIGDESVQLAKKYCSGFFASFLNAIIRKSIQFKKEDLLPQNDFSIRLSYPKFFVERLIETYGAQEAEKILTHLNKPQAVIARKINTLDEFVPMDRENIINNADYYIQNKTPAELTGHLFKHTTHVPETILDLCASPGGKLLLARELYPKAKLYANDVSEEKINLLKSNLHKYSVEATLTTEKGEEYSSDTLFDLIILDVPCSNTGVLHKKAEARWRLSKENIRALNATQKKLILNALKLLSPNGVIWFMTCSILPEENLSFLEAIKQASAFNVHHPLTITPENDRDGGFGCVLTKSVNEASHVLEHNPVSREL